VLTGGIPYNVGVVFSTLRILSLAALALCMTLGMLGNASATGLLGVAGDDPCGDACPCERELERGDASEAIHSGELSDSDAADHADEHERDGGDHVGATSDCEDDCPDCGSARHALAGLPSVPVVVRHPGCAQGQAGADLPPQSPMLDALGGVFRPPRAPARLAAA
jgi:hypothetical protein